MANTLTGKVIAISDRQTIQSKDASKQPVVKRQFYMDCTRFDPYTGERGFENTPLLEFSHKGLENLEALMAQGLKKDDVVTISFDVQGIKYEDKDKKLQVFTSIRPYKIELTKPKNQEGAQASQQQAASAPQGDGHGNAYNDANGNPLPF